MIVFFALAIGSLFAAATYLMLRRGVVRLVLGLSLLAHAANLLIFAMSRTGLRAGAPAFDGAVAPELMVDPLPQALILTAIVISFGITAFLLALAVRSGQAAGSDDLDAMSPPPESDH
jgi:multicomponent Na+:H+ antiporter subunit C